MNIRRSLVLSWFLVLICLTNCMAQQETEDDRLTAARTYQPPPTVLFMSLFRQIAGPRPGTISNIRPESQARLLRVRYQAAGLDESQIQVLQAIALDCVEQINRFDARASELTKGLREAARAGREAPNGPVVREELRGLEEQRDSTVSEAMRNLETALGKEAFERLQKSLAPKVFEDEFGRTHSSAAEFVIPEGLNRPGPPLRRADGTVVRQTEFESRLPIAITISTRPANHRAYRVGETIELWLTLTNRAETSVRIHPRDVLRHFHLRCRLAGENKPGAGDASGPPPFLNVDVARLIEYLPISQKDDQGREIVDLPSQSPIEVAVLRIPVELRRPGAPILKATTLGPGSYNCVFERPLGIIADEAETVEFANMSLRSNNVTIIVTQ